MEAELFDALYAFSGYGDSRPVYLQNFAPTQKAEHHQESGWPSSSPGRHFSGPAPINLVHDLFCPTDGICYCADCCRYPLPRLALSQFAGPDCLPRSEAGAFGLHSRALFYVRSEQFQGVDHKNPLSSTLRCSSCWYRNPRRQASSNLLFEFELTSKAELRPRECLQPLILKFVTAPPRIFRGSISDSLESRFNQAQKFLPPR